MFFITAIFHKADNDSLTFPTQNEAVCWGYVSEKEQAIDYVISNESDMHEDYYNWIVIEKISAGINQEVQEAIWFKWDNGLNQWVHTNHPGWVNVKKWSYG